MTSQLHDFSPGTGANGLFWMVQVPDNDPRNYVRVTEDTLTVHMEAVPVVDQFQFPGGAGNVLGTPDTPILFPGGIGNNTGTAGVLAKISFDVTYTRSGKSRRIRPASDDPLSPFNWAGKMWTATNIGNFSVVSSDGFTASGNFGSTANGASNFGEMGVERNGVFAHDDADDDADGGWDDTHSAKPSSSVPVQPLTASSAVQWAKPAAQPQHNDAKFRGRIPLRYIVH